MTAPADAEVAVERRGPMQMPPDFDWDLLFPAEKVDTAWMKDALCRREVDPESFYPAKHKKATGAKSVCGGCPVRAECLEYSLAMRDDFGVWGGESARERRKRRGDILRAVLAEREPEIEVPQVHEAAS